MIAKLGFVNLFVKGYQTLGGLEADGVAEQREANDRQEHNECRPEYRGRGEQE